jgi:hypothetical protein
MCEEVAVSLDGSEKEWPVGGPTMTVKSLIPVGNERGMARFLSNASTALQQAAGIRKPKARAKNALPR